MAYISPVMSLAMQHALRSLSQLHPDYDPLFFVPWIEGEFPSEKTIPSRLGTIHQCNIGAKIWREPLLSVRISILLRNKLKASWIETLSKFDRDQQLKLFANNSFLDSVSIHRDSDGFCLATLAYEDEGQNLTRFEREFYDIWTTRSSMI